MDKACFDPNDILVRTINTLAIQNIANNLVDIIRLWEPDNKKSHFLLGKISRDQLAMVYGRVPNTGISIDPMLLLRMELICDIHHFLELLAPELVQIDWVRRPHEAFQGHAPFDVMAFPDIQGLIFTRNFLYARHQKLAPSFCEKDHEP
jgi:hypothetical protein